MKKATFIILAGVFSAIMYFGSNPQKAIASSNDGILTDTTKKAKKAEVKPSTAATTTPAATTKPAVTTPVTKTAPADTAKAKKK